MEATPAILNFYLQGDGESTSVAYTRPAFPFVFTYYVRASHEVKVDNIYIIYKQNS